VSHERSEVTLLALRVEVGSAGSDSGRRGTPGPGHTTGVKQDPQAVVLEAGEAMAGSLDPLHAQVHALGGTVGGPGAVMVQDL
jgi:hypothetical protein